MRNLLAALCVIFLLAVHARAAPPNVLFIAVDDLNDWVGCLGGHPQVKTPNIDRLAARGMLFTNAHCQSPICNPSRTSLMTGLRPSTTGVYALSPWFRTAAPFKDVVTLPQHFAANGYVTMTCGKIYHDAFPPAEDRTNGKEFTTWGYHGSFGPYPTTKFVEQKSKSNMLDWGPFPATDEQTEDFKVADWAIAQLKSPPKDHPFFLCVGFRRPHVPCFAPPKWFDLYPEETLIMPPIKANDLDDVPQYSEYLHWHLPEPRLKWLQANNQWKSLVRAYLACVSATDAQVGRVLDALDQSGKADQTIVVLWSDHGWHLGEKGMTGKTSLWERSTHVPLIFAGPGIVPGKCACPVELLDVYPTLNDLCGLPLRDGLEGHTVVPQLKNPTAAREWPAISTQSLGNHAIRDERWRYIRYIDGSEELYDHVIDPNEWTNLARDSKYDAKKAELAKWLPKSNAAPLPGGFERLFEVRDGKLFYENKPIDPKDHQ